MKRFEVYKDTNENWHPSYTLKLWGGEGDLVSVALAELMGGYWRVSAWGADDYGFDRDFANQYDQALQCFLNLNS